MRSLIALTCVLLLASTAAARSLSNAKPAGTMAAAAPRLASVAAALQSTPQLSTLLAAVTAAGIDIPADNTWTILAPTNEAFEARLKKDLNMTPAKLLLPENKAVLTRVLQYHVIPAGAVLSSELKDNQTFATALEGASPLCVRVKTKEGKTYVKFVGATNWAKVVTPDVRAGKSVVHIVKDVLLPAGVGIAGDAEGWKAMKGTKMSERATMKGTKMGERATTAAAGGAALRMASVGAASKPCPSTMKKP